MILLARVFTLLLLLLRHVEYFRIQVASTKLARVFPLYLLRNVEYFI